MTSPARVVDLLSSLGARRGATQDELERLEEALKAVEKTLLLLNHPGEAETEAEVQDAPPAEFSLLEFAGKSQLQAIVMLAQRGDGVVTVREAKRMLLETGLTGSKNCASQVATSSIVRSGRFKWVAPGTYRLAQYPQLVKAG